MDKLTRYPARFMTGLVAVCTACAMILAAQSRAVSYELDDPTYNDLSYDIERPAITDNATPETPGAEEQKNAPDDGKPENQPNADGQNDAQDTDGPENAPDADEPEKPQDRVFLDADEIDYDEYTGMAVARGNVRLHSKDLRVSAPYVEYGTKTHIVDAYSDYREEVTLSDATERYTGKHLKYNVDTRRGVFTRVSGASGPSFMSGGRVRLMPYEEAAKSNIIHAAGRAKKNTSSTVAEWTGVTSTTCDFTVPHYKFVTRRAVIFPGKKTVLKRPRFYIGNSVVIPHPFDIVITERKKKGIQPIVDYDTDLGAGFGISGPLDLGRYGELDLEAVYWSQGEFETAIDYTYRLTNQLSLFASTKRLYNDTTEDTIWRPSWGLLYENAGWEAHLYWAQRELVSTEVETDVDEDRDVWRDPEVMVNSPWFGEPLMGGKFRLSAAWGRYGDNVTRREWTERIAYAAQYSWQPQWSVFIFKPFVTLRYRYFDYYDVDRDQEAVDILEGVKYKIGDFNFTSSYYRRWVDKGRSPMAWDRLSVDEHVFQSVAFPLPLGAPWEKWNFFVGAKYDLRNKKLSSILYSLSYNLHCMTWEMWYRDKRSEDEHRVGVTLFINAYPDNKLEIGSKSH